MPLDNHLFANIQEGAAKNVAFTYHIKEDGNDAPLKYSFATPHTVFDSLQRTNLSGCPPQRLEFMKTSTGS
jgi:hypothetical protein